MRSNLYKIGLFWSILDKSRNFVKTIFIYLGTLGVDINCLKSRTKAGHLKLKMAMIINTIIPMRILMKLVTNAYLAFGLMKRQLMSHMKGPSRGLIAT